MTRGGALIGGSSQSERREHGLARTLAAGGQGRELADAAGREECGTLDGHAEGAEHLMARARGLERRGAGGETRRGGELRPPRVAGVEAARRPARDAPRR